MDVNWAHVWTVSYKTKEWQLCPTLSRPPVSGLILSLVRQVATSDGVFLVVAPYLRITSPTKACLVPAVLTFRHQAITCLFIHNLFHIPFLSLFVLCLFLCLFETNWYHLKILMMGFTTDALAYYFSPCYISDFKFIIYCIILCC